MWLFIILASLILIPFLGRVYCGWICPVYTSLDLLQPVFKYSLTGKYAGLVHSKKVKTVLFVLFVSLFIVLKKVEFSVPFFILLIPIALVFALFIGTVQWHRICPFGTIFTLLASSPKKGYTFTSYDCLKCGLCARNCSSNCLTVSEKLSKDHKYCLSCGKCLEVCPQKNIGFGTLAGNTKAIEKQTEQV
jgi:polyferredoxin